MMPTVKDCLNCAESNIADGQVPLALKALHDAVKILNDAVQPEVKPLTIHDLRHQVNMAACISKPPETGEFVWTTQDFEIRRRK